MPPSQRKITHQTGPISKPYADKSSLPKHSRQMWMTRTGRILKRGHISYQARALGRVLGLRHGHTEAHATFTHAHTHTQGARTLLLRHRNPPACRARRAPPTDQSPRCPSYPADVAAEDDVVPGSRAAGMSSSSFEDVGSHSGRLLLRRHNPRKPLRRPSECGSGDDAIEHALTGSDRGGDQRRSAEIAAAPAHGPILGEHDIGGGHEGRA